MPADGRKIKGTIHWLSASDCAETDVVLYDKLFLEADMNAVESSKYSEYLNPNSKVIAKNVKVESLSDGLIASLNVLGKVDIEFIAEITSKTNREVIEALKGSIYQNPNTWGDEAREVMD